MDVPELDIAILGGVTARKLSGDTIDTIDIGPAKCQAVLAALAVAPGSAVPVPVLVERVWGAEPPRTAEKTLQSYVVRLRRALGPHVLSRVGAAYRLEVAEAQTDIGRFRALVASRDYALALGEWGGAPFAGLDCEGLEPLAAAMTEEWFAVTEADLDERVALNPAGTLVPLTELTSRYPLRERLWALLMKALYRVGRQADALRAFQTARSALIAELGIEPGPELTELEAAVLAQSLSLGVTHAPTGVPTGTVTFVFVVGAFEIVAESLEASGAHAMRSTPGTSGFAFGRASEAVSWSRGVQREAGLAGVELQVGIHCGEPELTRHGYFGPAVNIATRLASLAAPGSTLATAVTARLAGARDTTEIGRHSLPGVAGSQRLVRIDAPPGLSGGTWTDKAGNLPTEASPLIGRAAELGAVLKLVAEPGIVTLTGPGGVGKTSLGLAAAQHLAHASDRTCWYVELANITGPGEVPAAVGHALGVGAAARGDLTDTLVEVFAGTSDLVLLDNCEHVAAEAATFVADLAYRCQGVTMLATSREPLQIGGERVFAVPALDPESDGVKLFEERACAAALTFDPAADPETVAEICRRLDGMPLAIELAAAHVRFQTLPEILSRLDDHLQTLEAGHRATTGPPSMLTAAIAWSHDLLSDAEQDLLASLAVFVGPFDLSAASAVAYEERVPAERVDELLARLVERSILLVEYGTFARRFRLLETVRQCAWEKLQARGDAEAVLRRHAQWCCAEVQAIEADLRGFREGRGVARLDERWSNVRAAVSWSFAVGDHAMTWELIGPLGPEITLRRRNELGAWFERLVAGTTDLDDDIIAASLFFVANHRMLSLAPERYEELVRERGEPTHPLARLARAMLYDDDQAILAHAAAAAYAAREGGREVLAKMAQTVELSARFTVNPATAPGLPETEPLSGLRREGPPTLLQWALFIHGHEAEVRGDHRRADRLFDEACRVEIPDGTLSISPSIVARQAARAGDKRRALAVLAAHLGDLVDSDTPGFARVVAPAFVELLESMSCHQSAEPIRGFLRASAGDFGAQTARSILGDAGAADPATGSGEGEDFDDREAVSYMATTIRQLIETP